MPSHETPQPDQSEKAEVQAPLHVEVSGQTLQVNGRTLDPSDGEAVLLAALTDGREAILHGLEQFRDYIQGLHPDAKVGLAPFETMLLPGKPKDVLSAAGLERHKHHEQVFPEIEHLQDQFHPFWRAVETSGYFPEVRVHGHQNGWYPIYLWAHFPHAVPAQEQDPLLSVEQLPHLLGFTETDLMKDIKQRWAAALAASGSEAKQLNEIYSKLVNEESLQIAKTKDERDYIRAQVGINIAASLVWRDAWQTSRQPEHLQAYIDDLNDVLLQIANEAAARPVKGWDFGKTYSSVEAEIAAVKKSMSAGDT